MIIAKLAQILQQHVRVVKMDIIYILILVLSAIHHHVKHAQIQIHASNVPIIISLITENVMNV